MLDGAEAAREMLEKGAISSQSHAHTGPWLERAMHKYALQRPVIDEAVTMQIWILIQTEGIFLLRLEGRDEHGEVVEHAVAVEGLSEAFA